MTVTEAFVNKFANDWLAAWNNSNIDGIMGHYAEDVIFSSPFIITSRVNEQGTIYGKTALRAYFENALALNPDLYFDLKHIMVGIDSITLIYTRKQVMLAAESMILNKEGLIKEGRSHYPVDKLFPLI